MNPQNCRTKRLTAPIAGVALVSLILAVWIASSLRAGVLPPICQTDPCDPACCEPGVACCDDTCCDADEIYCCNGYCVTAEEAALSGCLQPLHVKWNSPCPTGPCDGSSWEMAFHELQDALDHASTSGYRVAEIWVAGTNGIGIAYYPDQGAQHTASNIGETFLLVNNVAVFGGFEGIENSLTERNPDPFLYKTILSGYIDNGTSNSFRVVTAGNVSPATILDGFIIEGGREIHPPGPGGFPVGGAGLFISGGSPTIGNCIFRDNESATWGGGVLIKNGSPRFENCRFTANTADAYGGAVYADGGSASVEFLTCLFDNNQALDGGAIGLSEASAIIYTSTIVDNLATGGSPSTGGGIFSTGTTPGDITVNSCILWGNQDTDGQPSTSQISASGGTVSVDYSIIEDGWTGTENLDDDPLLDQNHVPTCMSPARDTGDPAYLSAAYATPTDLTFAPRVIACTVDRGAFEFPGAPDCGLALRCTDRGGCSDCNQNLIPDVCDILAGTSPDCNTDGLPDDCEINPQGGALWFAGVQGGWVDIPDQELAGDFTIEAWVHLDDYFPGNGDAIVGQEGSGQDINFAAGRLRLFDPPVDVIRAKTPATPLVWTHYAISRFDSDLALYINGDLDTNGTWSGPFVPKAIGRSNVGYLYGALDEVRLWNIARSPEQIRDNYRRRVSADSPGLIGYWSFDETGDDLRALDASPLGQHGTLQAASVYYPYRFAPRVPYIRFDCDRQGVPEDCYTPDSVVDCDSDGVPDACRSAPEYATAKGSCSEAMYICTGDIYAGFLEGAGYTGCTDGTLEPDAWFRYRPSTSGTLNISVCASSISMYVSVHSTCPAPRSCPFVGVTLQPLACNDGASICRHYTQDLVFSVNVDAGRDYWIRLHSLEDGGYEVLLDGPPCAQWADCNSNGVADSCDMLDGTSVDCNSNGIPDECEIRVSGGLPGTTYYCIDNCNKDCNSNGVPDECDVDCNENGVPDDCDIARGPDAGDPVVGGPIIIGGDDADHHGGFDPVQQTNLDGWLYIQEAFNVIGPLVRNGNTTVVCVGSWNHAFQAFESGFAYSDLSGTWSTVHLQGVNEIHDFFENVGATRIQDAGIIYISSDVNSVPGGISWLDLEVVNVHAEALAAFVENGGGLFVHDQSGVSIRWGWLNTLLPGICPVPAYALNLGCTYEGPDSLRLTTAGSEQLGLTNEVITNATPWHSFMDGDLGGLDVLVEGACTNGYEPSGYLPVIIGGAQVTFAPPGSRDCNSNGIPDECELTAGTAADIDTNGILDECEVEQPTAIIVAFLDCDTNGPVDDEIGVDECDLVCIDGIMSTSNIGNTDLAFFWDISTNGPPNFSPPDLIGPDTFVTWTSDGCPNDCSGGGEDYTVYHVALRVENADGGWDVTSRGIRVYDLAPTSAMLSGPDTLKVGQEGCFEILATSPCDPIVDYAWSFERPDSSFFTTNGPAPGHLVVCYAWPDHSTLPYEVEVAVTIRDSDGDTLVAVSTVGIEAADGGYIEQTAVLAVETAFHAVETDPADPQYIEHSASMYLRNIGEVALPGPFAVVFSELAPTGTLVDRGLTDPPVSGTDPYITWELPSGARLEPGAETDWQTVSWKVPSATDEAGLTFTAVPYTLQQPPQFDASIIADAWEGELYRTTVHATDPEGDTVYYELGGDVPTGMTLHSRTGDLSWSPSESFCGPADSVAAPITIIAKDGFAGSATTQGFPLTVHRVNRPPSIDSEADLVAVAYEEYTYAFKATDPDGDEITLTVVEPYGMMADPEIGPNGLLETVIDWTPTADDKPGRWVFLMVDDGEYVVDQEYFLEVLTCPSPPTIGSINNLNAIEGQVFRHQVTGLFDTCLDNPQPYFWLDPAPQGMMITEHGHIEWLPWYNDHGTKLVRVYASCTEFLEDDCYDTETFTVTVEDRNIAPEFVPLSDDTATEGLQYNRQILATDDDGDRLRYQLLEAPTGMTIGQSSGLISWQVPQWMAAVQDVHTVGVRVIDAANAYVDTTYALQIIEIDVPPEIISQPIRYAYEQVPYDYTLSFKDKDHPPGYVPQWDFKFMEYPDWVTTNGLSIEGTPKLGARFDSPYHVRVEVSDDQVPNLVGVQPFDITVYSPVMHSPPEILFPDLEHVAIVGEPYAQRVEIKDVDQPAEIGFDFFFEVARYEDDSDILCEAALDEFGEARCDGGEVTSIGFVLDTSTSGWIDWEAVALAGATPPQTYLVSLWAQDGDANWSYAGYSLTVFAADQGEPPAFLTAPTNHVAVGETFDWRIEIADPDVPAGLQFDFAQGTCDGIAPKPLPAGMHLDVDAGNDPRGADLLWTPTASDVGQYCVKVTVTDADDHMISRKFPLAATLSGNNSGPEITSVPPNEFMVVNQLFEYDVDATDPDEGDVLTFTLEGERPTGAEIDPITGRFTWTPILAYAHTRPVITVRVTDSEGLGHEQLFSYYVYPTNPTNLAPDIITELSTVTLSPGQTWMATTQFADDDSTAWTARVLQGPPSLGDLTVDPIEKTVDVDWTPTAQDVGLYNARLRVTDDDGAFDELPFILDISDGNAPHVLSTAPKTAQIGLDTTYPIETDQDDIQQSPYVVSYQALRKPAGAAISVDGIVTWTPLPEQVGNNSFIVRITNSTGNYTDHKFAIVASDAGGNLAPAINSDPVLRASSSSCASDPDACYAYAIQATDDEGPHYLTYAVAGPVGIAFDSREKNLLRWDVSNVAAGTYPVTVKVTDRHLATAVQHFDITVSTDGMNRPPEIRSAPVTTVQTGAAYTYAVEVYEPDGDNLNPPTIVSVPSAAGLAFSGNTLTWDPAGSTGAYEIILSVADEHGAEACQSFALAVHADASGTNESPLIITDPITRVVRGRSYEYVVEAYDPDGAAPTVTLESGPSESTGFVNDMTPTQGNGTVTLAWQTDPADPAQPAEVVVVATDDDGASAVQRFTIELLGNTAPRIRSIAPPAAVEEVEYEYVLDIADPEDSVFACTVVGIPPEISAGDVACANDVFTWTPDAGAARTDPYEFEIEVVDGSGASDRQRFAVLVRDAAGADLYDPDLEVIATLNSNWQTATITVRAIDDVGISSTGLTVTEPGSGQATPVPVTLVDGAGTVIYPPAGSLTVTGGYDVAWTVVDANDNRSTVTTEFLKPLVSGGGTPDAEITNPIGDEEHIVDGISQTEITAPTFIHGRAYVSGGDLYRYELSYRRVGDPVESFVVFAAGTNGVGGQFDTGELGVIDPTRMENGLYEVVATAWNFAGTSATSPPVFYSITGNLKVGHFTMSFEDMSVPVSGIPISITRTYDSRVKTVGDFGAGWRMEFASLKLQETAPMGQLWGRELAGSGGNECFLTAYQSHSVTVTWPDGRSEIFEFRPSAQTGYAMSFLLGFCEPIPIQSYQFERTSAGTSTLDLLPGHGLTSQHWVDEFGIIGDISGQGPAWQPSGYVLTAGDGTKYEFQRTGGAFADRTLKLTTVTDRNGNVITFDDTGVHHSAGKEILIQRVGDRVRRITDPAGKSIRYIYDLAGNLTSVIDQEGNETKFRYNFKNELVEVLDPRGIPVAKNVYADEGRLIKSVDAEGYEITQEYYDDADDLNTLDPVPAPVANPDGESQQVVGAQRVTDRIGRVREFHYDRFGNVIRERKWTTALDFQDTEHVYDANGNELYTIHAEPAAHHPDPNNANCPAEHAQTGRCLYTSSTYDSFDNVLSERDIDGNITTYTYNNFQQVKTITSPDGKVTTYQYDPQGNLTQVINPDPEQTFTEFTYDAQGDLEYSYDAERNDSRQITNEFGYVTQSIDALDNVTDYEYDELGRQTTETRHRYVYKADAMGQIVPDGALENLVTETFYDDLGRVVRTVDPLGNETLTTYNKIGKQESVTTVNGTTFYVYDVRGNLIRTTHPDQSTDETKYDAEGRSIARKDRDGRWTCTEYDAFDRVVRSSVPSLAACDPSPLNWTHSLTEYDKMGRVKREWGPRYSSEGTDAHATRYEYLPHKRKVRVYADVHNMGEIELVTTNAFDIDGRLMQTTDADGNITTFQYDALGRQTKVFYPPNHLTFSKVEYDKAGRKTAEIDQAVKRTEFKYDELGRLIEVHDAALGDKKGVTKYHYDELGNRVAQTDAEGRITIMQYDGLGRLTGRILPLGEEETFTYGTAGNMDAHTDFNEDTTTYTYDNNGRMRTKSAPYSTFMTQVNGPANEELQANFRYVVATDTLQIDITHNFASLDFIRIEYANGSGVPFEASSTGSPLHEDWGSPPLAHLVAGLLVLKVGVTGSVEKPEATIEAVAPEDTTYDYLASGLRTEAGGDTYGYDQRGRLSWEIKASGERLDYDYDDAGNRTLLEVTTNGQGTPSTTTAYVFDHLNRLISVTDDGGTSFTTYGYDRNGNRAAVTYPNGTVALYTYDEQNRLKTLENRRDGPTGDVLSSFVYTVGPAGNRTDVVETLWPLGDPAQTTELVRTIHYDYDALYRLTREYAQESNGTILDVSYHYDKVGNREVMVREEIEGQLGYRHTTTYQYDDDDRLTGSTTVTVGITLTAREQLDRYYASRPRPWTRWFAFSFVGLTLVAFWAPLFVPSRRRLGHRARRKRLFTACIATFLVPLMAVDLRSVDAAFTEALQVQAAIAAGVPLSCPPDTVCMTYGYDANGNQISRTRVNAQGAATDTYTFDYQNRLAGAITNIDTAPTLVDYTYDADGIRTSKTINKSAGTYYLTDKNQAYAQVVEERSNVGQRDLIVAYTYGDDLISQRRPNGAVTRYYHYDGQMSTRQLTDDATGAAVAINDRYAYDAFGVGIRDEGGSDNSYRYTGEQYDASVGQYYLRARYYNSTVGRFLSRDPFGGLASDPHTLHKYVYTKANPVNAVDPSGLITSGTLTLFVLAGFILLFTLALGLAYVRNPGSARTPRGQFVPVNRSRLRIYYQSIRIRSSTKSPDELFNYMRQLSKRPLFPVQASADVSAVGDEISFDQIPGFNELGQGDFSVRVTQYVPEERYFVVRTLAGHPYAGWRYWGIVVEPNGAITIETVAVVHPVSYSDQVKAQVGNWLGQGEHDVWANLLARMWAFSGGTIDGGFGTNIGGRGWENGERRDKYVSIVDR